MKYLILLLLLTTGCQMTPLTPEERAHNLAVGQALMGYSQQTQQQQQGTGQQCTIVDMGGGIYDKRCH